MYSDNLKKIRKTLKLSVDKFANIVDIPAPTLWGYEGKKRLPSIELPIQLYKKLNVNLNWFISGNGEMFNNQCENTHVLAENSDCINRFKNWGDRLCNILSENMITPKEFAKRTKINPDRIENFILNSVEPTMAEINAIKSNVDISIDELFYGEKVVKSHTALQPQFTAEEILKLKKLINP